MAGDFVGGAGGGGGEGESIWGKKFRDDPLGLQIDVDRKGLIGMCNEKKKNSNNSQWFITFGPQKRLKGKHVFLTGAGCPDFL